MGKGLKISSQWISELKTKLNIVDYIGEFVVLTKRGSEHTGLCPFHAEKSPSFSVSENKQLYHCYGCKAGGDLIQFSQQIAGLSFQETIAELAEKAQLKIPFELEEEKNLSPQELKKRKELRERKQIAYRLNRFAAGFFKNQIKIVPSLIHYLDQRGIKSETADEYYLGGTPTVVDGLVQFLKKSKAPLELAETLGLIRKSNRSNDWIDAFRNRALFPIAGLTGKINGFGGRLIPSEKDSGSVAGPKYLNSPDSFLFHKSENLYGLFQAGKYIRNEKKVYLVEGYYDVLSLYQAGIRNVVATCGTALTESHVRLLQKFNSQIILLFDGDTAGLKAMRKSMELGLRLGVLLEGLFLPQGKDPDEFFRGKAKQESEHILSQAKPLLDLELEKALEKAIQGPQEQTELVKDAVQLLNMCKDPVVKEVRLNWLKDKLGPLGVVIEKRINMGPTNFQQERKINFQSSPNQQKTKKIYPLKRVSDIEKMLFYALVQWDSFSEEFQKLRSKLPREAQWSDIFEVPVFKKLTDFAIEKGLFEKGQAAFLEVLDESQEEPQVRTILTEALFNKKQVESQIDINKAFQWGVFKAWAQFSHKLKRELLETENPVDQGRHAELMKEYLDVQRKMKEFNDFYEKI